jgi:hypothetical protein
MKSCFLLIIPILVLIGCQQDKAGAVRTEDYSKTGLFKTLGSGKTKKSEIYQSALTIAVTGEASEGVGADLMNIFKKYEPDIEQCFFINLKKKVTDKIFVFKVVLSIDKKMLESIQFYSPIPAQDFLDCLHKKINKENFIYPNEGRLAARVEIAIDPQKIMIVE